jgi:hypothetical protein
MVDVLTGKEEVSFGENFNHNFSKNTLGRLDDKCWKIKHFSIPKGSRRRHVTLTSDEHILRNQMLMISESSIT